jgi:hypothetical protein
MACFVGCCPKRSICRCGRTGMLQVGSCFVDCATTRADKEHALPVTPVDSQETIFRLTKKNFMSHDSACISNHFRKGTVHSAECRAKVSVRHLSLHEGPSFLLGRP